MKKYKRILIVNPFAIGDIISSTAVIDALRKKFPDSFIGYICNSRVQSILANDPRINEIFVFEISQHRKLWKTSKIKCIMQFIKFLTRIRKNRFEVSIDISLGDRYSFFLKLLGVPKRIGFNYKRRGRFQTDKVDILGFDDKHVVKYYFDLLKPIGIDGQPPDLKVFLGDEDKGWAQSFLKSHNINDEDVLVGIDPAGGESFGPWADIKRWPVECFAQVSDRLINEFGVKVVILAGPKEKDVVEKLSSLMKGKPIDASESSLMQMAALIERCNLLICNDTGPMRFGDAFKNKVLALFGPTDSKVYGCFPYRDNVRVLKADNLDCGPCYKRFKLPECTHKKKCLSSISIDDVFMAAKSLIENN